MKQKKTNKITINKMNEMKLMFNECRWSRCEHCFKIEKLKIKN